MKPRELEWNLQALFDGRLDGVAFDALEAELRNNPDARAAYRETLHLHHALCQRAIGVDLLRVVPMDQVNARSQRRFMKVAALSAAAAIALVASVMAFFFASQPQPTLVFKKSAGSELVVSHTLAGDKLPTGKSLEPGSRLELKSGTVELQFSSGVRGILQGPAEVTLQRENLLDLTQGTAWFEVPPNAIGLQVRTPNTVLTDLGTEFGIVSMPKLLDEAHVFTGSVEVMSRHGHKESTVLHAGNARAADSIGRWHEIPLNSERFLRKLPDEKPVAVSLDAVTVFTSSPRNEMVRKNEYHFDFATALAGFDPSGSDKLVVTLSHERGEIRSVRYGGVEMVKAVGARSSGAQFTAIYYLDSPGPAANLTVGFEGTANGVGGSLFALSNVRPGKPAVIGSQPSRSLQVQVQNAGSLVIASHAHNQNDIDVVSPATIAGQFHPVFDGATGSSVGGSGYHAASRADNLDVKFRGRDGGPVTVAAVFEPSR
jgi:ferric-dicitrate binding protein FerR (iron transport regulator)